MKPLRNLLTRFLTIVLIFVLPVVFSQAPESAGSALDSNRPFHNNVRTILLLTSYPVADSVTSNFFDAFRKGIRDLNLPIDCHVVELNATINLLAESAKGLKGLAESMEEVTKFFTM